MAEIDVIEILTKYPDCRNNGGKFRAILMDLYPNASKAIVNTLVLMSDCGIVEEIYSAKQIDSFHESRWKKKLEDDYGISDKIICKCLLLMTKSDAKQQPSINDAGVKNQVDEGSTKPIDTVSKMPKPSLLSDFEIENGVLKKYKGISSHVVIPDSVTSIGAYAFFRCTDLFDIVIPNSVTIIGAGAFGHCIRLANIVIPDSVTSIGYRAFEDCRSLRSITIPDSVTNIDLNAFFGCEGLTSIYYTGDIAKWCGINGLDNLMLGSRTLYIGGKKVESELTLQNEKCEQTERKYYCPDCGNEIKDMTQDCPNCGCPNEFFSKSIFDTKINKKYIYCSVIYLDAFNYKNPKQYYYISDDDSIKVGDHAIVMVGQRNDEKEVIIKKVEIFDKNYPFPPEITKHIIRKL